MVNSELKNAIDLVNSTRRSSADPKLIHYVECERCGSGFAKMAQDFGLAESHGYAHICRVCKPGKRRR